MDPIVEKAEVFGRIWHVFKSIEDVLKKAKVPEGRFPDYNKLQEAMVEAHINKLRHGEEWLNTFITTHIKPWQRVRSENPETYWENVAAFGMGNELTEVKKLNELSKKIRADWFTTHNFLAPLKREKKEKKDGQE